MHGYPIRIELEGLGITLRPFKQSEMENFASLFGSMNVHRYTMGTSAYTGLHDIYPFWGSVTQG